MVRSPSSSSSLQVSSLLPFDMLTRLNNDPIYALGAEAELKKRLKVKEHLFNVII